MGQRGILAVISGFSGAGKGTLMKALLAKYPDQYALSVSATTRAPREGEADGREYFFVSVPEFERMIREGELLEYASYVGNYYGTPAPYVKKNLDAGKSVLLEIEMQGAFQVREKIPGTCMIFIAPPSAEELERRLRGRGTETEEAIQKRLRRAAEESLEMGRYEYLVINDDLDSCVEELHRLIEAQKNRLSERAPFVARMQAELSRYFQRG